MRVQDLLDLSRNSQLATSHPEMRYVGERFVDPIYAGSHERMAVIMANYQFMADNEWYLHLLENWTACDDVGLFCDDLRELLTTAPKSILLQSMSSTEIELWESLPEQFEVWRGCGEWNEMGLSWTLDVERARNFMKNCRYYCPNNDTVQLLSAMVNKHDVILRLDRGESEVIVLQPLEIEYLEYHEPDYSDRYSQQSSY